jgi:hypothetical protein
MFRARKRYAAEYSEQVLGKEVLTVKYVAWIYTLIATWLIVAPLIITMRWL